MIVKMGIDLARGFGPWKEMFVKNEHKLNAHGGRLVFAGTEKDNDNKLTVIMDFDSPEEKYISKLVRFSLIKLRVYKDKITQGSLALE